MADDLADTLANTQGIDLPAEIAEFTIDQVIDAEILKEIPVVSSGRPGIHIVYVDIRPSVHE